MHMVMITKIDGSVEEFDKEKLKTSLLKAGASENNASKVADTVEEGIEEGMNSSDIKAQAASALRDLDQASAETYESRQQTIPAE